MILALGVVATRQLGHEGISAKSLLPTDSRRISPLWLFAEFSVTEVTQLGRCDLVRHSLWLSEDLILRRFFLAPPHLSRLLTIL